MAHLAKARLGSVLEDISPLFKRVSGRKQQGLRIFKGFLLISNLRPYEDLRLLGCKKKCLNSTGTTCMVDTKNQKSDSTWPIRHPRGQNKKPSRWDSPNPSAPRWDMGWKRSLCVAEEIWQLIKIHVLYVLCTTSSLLARMFGWVILAKQPTRIYGPVFRVPTPPLLPLSSTSTTLRPSPYY